jgi:hypothetical protein
MQTSYPTLASTNERIDPRQGSVFARELPSYFEPKHHANNGPNHKADAFNIGAIDTQGC